MSEEATDIAPDFVFRIQSPEDGRGPYRPGFSHVWTDMLHEARNPTIMDEFGLDLIEAMSPNNANGCAFDCLEQAGKWFSPIERKKLDRWGYCPFIMRAKIVARSERQLLVTRPWPFVRRSVRLSWDHVDAAVAFPLGPLRKADVHQPIQDEP
jgi:hypothetical protein